MKFGMLMYFFCSFHFWHCFFTTKFWKQVIKGVMLQKFDIFIFKIC